ncbi:ribonuclease H-like domain-containing protein [Aspergillus candidus]|uniref:Ribonuclease H-like domain-containing protein n=1 Tax=Aspergillus candidus TaxID=41067 RepID=A0A2I2EZT6_ASPCN|nr:ribonuclease H-like domain-containing protein [Aspergillus candidus]PLB33886.1 ribonuclease H-like domain-containing protein [Aspergillus candidus]
MTDPSPKIIDTTAAIGELAELLTGIPNNPPSIYVDLEGVNLCRHGSISIMQIFSLPKNEVYLIDVHTLGQEAFSHPSTSGRTLKGILEDESIHKAFFDVRNDSDALYAHFGVYLAGIQDLQLFELATRSGSRRFINGLSRCIQCDAGLTFFEARMWKDIKEDGRQLFAPERGGSYEVFNSRPLSEAIIKYCAQDVRILPKLWAVYNGRLGWRGREKIEVATRDRINVCFQAGYTGVGRHMAQSPSGFA